MCWFIYGAVQGNIDDEDLNNINSRHVCRLAKGTRHDVKMAAQSEVIVEKYHVTRKGCDCDSPIGEHNMNDDQVQDLAHLLCEVGELPGSDTISIYKTWIGTRNKREIKLKLSNTDLVKLAADFESSTLYTLSCRKQ